MRLAGSGISPFADRGLDLARLPTQRVCGGLRRFLHDKRRDLRCPSLESFQFIHLPASLWTFRPAPPCLSPNAHSFSPAKSYAKNIATLFVIQLLVQWTWQIVVYPLFLSPLRHLPQPPVGLTFGATAVEPQNTDIL
jgi:hypothetical protein